MNLTSIPKGNVPLLPIAFKYKKSDGQISMLHVMPGTVYLGTTEVYGSPQLLMEVYDLDAKIHRVLAIRDIVHEPLPLPELQLGDRVRYIPEFKSQRVLEGIVCFIDGERIYFYSGIMPEVFYGQEAAKRPGKNISYEGEMYNWELMIQPRQRLEKI